MLYVGDDSLSAEDDTDGEERGGEGVNNIIQPKETRATRKRQNWVVILPLATPLFHGNTSIHKRNMCVNQEDIIRNRRTKR